MIKNKGLRVFLLLLGLIISIGTAGIYVKQFTDGIHTMKRCTAQTSGTVYTNIPSSSGPVFAKNVGVRYEIDGIAYHARGRDQIWHNYGETTAVHYDPADPSVSYAGTSPVRMDELIVTLLVFSGGAVCAAAVRIGGKQATSY